MLRLLPLLVAAAAVAPRAGCRPPRAQLEVRVIEASKPQLAWLRCRTLGLGAPVKYAWKLGASVKQVGYNIPRDEGALLVQLPDAPAGSAVHVECTATDADGATASASTTLAPIAVKSAAIAAGVLTVDGAGFGPERGTDDSLFLIPSSGPTMRADHACKQASWNDVRIVACAPAGVHGALPLRVQSGGRLAAAPAPVTLP
jgi:hypothetical protein